MDVFSFYQSLFQSFVSFLSLPINLGICTISIWSVFIGSCFIVLFISFIRKLFD